MISLFKLILFQAFRDLQFLGAEINRPFIHYSCLSFVDALFTAIFHRRGVKVRGDEAGKRRGSFDLIKCMCDPFSETEPDLLEKTATCKGDEKAFSAHILEFIALQGAGEMRHSRLDKLNFFKVSLSCTKFKWACFSLQSGPGTKISVLGRFIKGRANVP